MSAPGLRITELPVEILEQILGHLPGQDIIGVEAISRQFRDLARSSPVLLYQRELFLAGLVDNPLSPCNLGERRRLCKDYAHRWSDAARIMKHTRELPLEFQSWHENPTKPGKNLLAKYRHQSDKIEFLHVPPATSEEPIERWTIPISFDFPSFTTYPPKNILVAAEKDTDHGIARIHLLNLLDGSPYRAPPSNVITCTFSPRIQEFRINTLDMTASRVVMHALERDPPTNVDVWRMAVWDWTTGDLVFDRSSGDGSGSVGPYGQIAFLDEFRIMVTHYAPNLLVFNTSLPQDHPGNLRKLELPPKYSRWYTGVHLDRIWESGGPLNVDPAQAIFVMDLRSVHGKPRAVSVVRKQSLLEHACSMREDALIPWDEWGKGATTMEIPHDGFIIVHGPRMLALLSGSRRGRRMHVFDFRLRKNNAPRLSNGNDGGGAVVERRSCEFEGYGPKLCSWSLQLLGDSLVSYFRPPFGESSGVLQVLDLM